MSHYLIDNHPCPLCAAPMMISMPASGDPVTLTCINHVPWRQFHVALSPEHLIPVGRDMVKAVCSRCGRRMLEGDGLRYSSNTLLIHLRALHAGSYHGCSLCWGLTQAELRICCPECWPSVYSAHIEQSSRIRRSSVDVPERA